MKSQLTRKDPIVGKDGWQEKKGVTEDEMIGWHHGLNEHDSEQIPVDSDGQEAFCAAFHGVTKSQTQLSD